MPRTSSVRGLEPASAGNVMYEESYDDIINTIQLYKDKDKDKDKDTRIDVDYLVNVLHTKMIMSNNQHATLLRLTELLTEHGILDTVKRADTHKQVFQDGGNRRKIKRHTRRSTYRKLRRSTIRRR